MMFPDLDDLPPVDNKELCCYIKHNLSRIKEYSLVMKHKEKDPITKKSRWVYVTSVIILPGTIVFDNTAESFPLTVKETYSILQKLPNFLVQTYPMQEIRELSMQDTNKCIYVMP